MPPQLIYWIKFSSPASNTRTSIPQKFVFDSPEDMWHRLREILVLGSIIEWMVRD